MPPKKRGRKPKKTKEQDETAPKKVHKKRGRKPKGGKIIKKINEKVNEDNIKKPNIILQLKCSSKDLENHNENIFANQKMDEEIKSYNLKNNKQTNIKFEQYNNITYKPTNQPNTNEPVPTENTADLKEIWEKLRILKLKLHLNEVSDKRSHCFWCTCRFDNPPIYIPKQERNNIIEVYGCFCSPECAVAYLKNEPIDCSVLWERYALLNNIYSKIYNYEKNIKPAPNPYYTLDKYYGNLTIQEYRKLLSKDRLLLVVDKPLTKILPELYEENNELPNIFDDILSTKTHKQPQYRLKRKQVGNSKLTSLTSNFGLNN
jgi:hypothetical protein